MTWETTTCPREGCHTLLALPADVLEKIRKTHESIQCPFGHGFYFPGKTDEEKLRERLQCKDDIIASKDREIAALKRKPRKPRKPRAITKKKP